MQPGAYDEQSCHKARGKGERDPYASSSGKSGAVKGWQHGREGEAVNACAMGWPDSYSPSYVKAQCMGKGAGGMKGGPFQCAYVGPASQAPACWPVAGHCGKGL